MSAFDLPENRLATTDEEGRRIYLEPADVRGKWRLRRGVFHSILILVFLALPWLRIGGRQAVWLDLAHLRFTVFGLSFHAHDAPMLVFVAGGAALTLAFVTALGGRAWCGWACPQTVFIDFGFRRVERWLEGDAVARRRLNHAPWGLDKTVRRTLKWSAFGFMAAVISHSFLAYFVGTDALLTMMRASPWSHPAPFLVMAAVSLLVLFDFGWFREQFCTIVCPYGRFQSVLMDSSSLAVTYDAKRSDCVNCYRCVQVCPTGIDIRRGLQLECIACTACIDACDRVMEKVGKPPGLIRYMGSAPFRPRTIAFGLLLLGAMTGLAATVHSRKPVSIRVARAAGEPFQLVNGGRVVNAFRLELTNEEFEPETIRLETAAAGIRIVAPELPLVLPEGASRRISFFIDFPAARLEAGRARESIVIVAAGRRWPEEVTLVGPGL